MENTPPVCQTAKGCKANLTGKMAATSSLYHNMVFLKIQNADAPEIFKVLIMLFLAFGFGAKWVETCN